MPRQTRDLRLSIPRFAEECDVSPTIWHSVIRTVLDDDIQTDRMFYNVTIFHNFHNYYYDYLSL